MLVFIKKNKLEFNQTGECLYEGIEGKMLTAGTFHSNTARNK